MTSDGLMTLSEAAKALRYENTESFRRAVHRDKLPHIKLGKRLLFILDDLINHMKKNDNVECVKSDSTKEDNLCHLSNVAVTGGVGSPHQVESEYSNLLKQTTGNKRRNTKTR